MVFKNIYLTEPSILIYCKRRDILLVVIHSHTPDNCISTQVFDYYNHRGIRKMNPLTQLWKYFDVTMIVVLLPPASSYGLTMKSGNFTKKSQKYSQTSRRTWPRSCGSWIPLYGFYGTQDTDYSIIFPGLQYSKLRGPTLCKGQSE